MDRIEPSETGGARERPARQTLPFGNAMHMPVAFSDAVSVDLSGTARMVWVSGQLAFNEHEELVGRGDMAAQTEQVLANIARILGRFGGTLDDVVSVTVFVRDMADLRQIHTVRLRHFHEPFPTSTLVRISEFVHPDALIEISAQAVIGQTRG